MANFHLPVLPVHDLDRPQVTLAPEFLCPEHVHIEILRFAAAQELRRTMKCATAKDVPADERTMGQVIIASAKDADLLRANLMKLYAQMGMNAMREVHALMLMEEGLKNAVRKRFRKGSRAGKWVGHHLPMEKIDEETQREVAYQEARVRFGVAIDRGQPAFMLHMRNKGKSFNPYRVPDHTNDATVMELEYGRGFMLMGEFGEAMGGRVMYLPSNDTEDPAQIDTRELLLSMPVPYPVDEAVRLFQLHLPADPLAPPPAAAEPSVETAI